MRSKTLIVVTLIAVMLFSCFLPIVEVLAADEPATSEAEETGPVEMTFNTPLYKALKSYFREAGTDAKYNDVNHTITMNREVINGVEALSLKEKGITDITGLDIFKNVKSLILSANNLTEDSNLGILNNLLELSYLDLSSNAIKDVSSIETLITNLLEIDSNAVNLSSQVASKVFDVELDAGEEKVLATYSLPQILSMAGIVENGFIKNKGYLKADWFKEYDYASSCVTIEQYPRLDLRSVPNPVSSSKLNFNIEVGKDSLAGYTPYYGLIKLVIKITDDGTGAYNPNPASENILKDSTFTLFFVVHPSTQTGAIIKDKNLYYAIKEQLIKDQEINPNLLSYRYGTTLRNEVAYDICEYTVNTTTHVATLYIDGTAEYTIEEFYGSNGESKVTNLRTGSVNKLPYTLVDVSTADASGNVTTKRKVKLAHINEDRRNLYVDAWDEAQAFVITDLDIINKITSLILNDKEICDLSGLENFVGLESNLNVSYNYIRDLKSVYFLDKNKTAAAADLKAQFIVKREAMNAKKNKVITAYNKIIASVESIKEEIKKISENITILNTVAADSPEYGKAQTAIESSKKKIYGDPANPEDRGLMGDIEVSLEDDQDGLNYNLSAMYPRFRNMYTIFNKMYKMATILTPELNYLTEEEYEAYLAASKTKEGARTLSTDQAKKIETLDKAGALSDFEKELLVSAFGLRLSDEQKFPVSYALTELVKEYTEDDMPRSTWTAMNLKFIECGLYSNAVNYCLIERMNNDTATGICNAAEYFEKLLLEYEYEDIDPELAEAIYQKITEDLGSSKYTARLYAIFEEYLNKELDYSGTTMSACKGPYHDVESLEVELVETTNPKAGTYPSAVKILDIVNGKKATSGAFFFHQLMNLANKFSAVDETDRYVKLPPLKKLDIRNNEIESLGPVEIIAVDEAGRPVVDEEGNPATEVLTLASLKELKELYAGHNFVSGDISCVDWSTLTRLKALDLSYNFIDDISPLQVLTNLKYLDVSDNLLKGPFNLSLREMRKLKDIKLAGNRFTDITRILNDYEMIAGGDFTRYFAREDTLNIDLSRQTLEIEIKDPIEYNPAARVKEIELPLIFAQLEHIDATRTAFGTTSSKGSIQARGGIAYIPVHEEGDYEAEVTVIAANGYPEDVSTSVGIGTKCTIKYSVRDMGVSGIVINETSITSVAKGTSQKFTATVQGANVSDTRVLWRVEGNTSTGTGISDSGLLVVGVNETAPTLTIIATSAIDNKKEARKVIAVQEPELEKVVTAVTVTADKTTVAPGEEIKMKATVDGLNLKPQDQAVIWSITGKTSTNTRISEDGVLKVGENETAKNLIITATSVTNSEKSGSLSLAIQGGTAEPENPNPVEPDDPTKVELGYKVSSDGTSLKGISPDTTVTNFKNKLISVEGYTIDIKRNGVTVADGEKIATADLVIITKDSKMIGTYEAIVKGDVNGDGTADATDSSLIKAHRSKITLLTGAFLEAADINEDGEVDITDIRLLLYHRAKLDGYIL